MTVEGIADLTPLRRAREQRAWYWYDWANSAFVTTTAAVLFSPYLTSVAEKAACGRATDQDAGYTCTTDLHVLGLSVSAGSLVFYIVTISTILSAVILPVVGAVADRSSSKPRLLGVDNEVVVPVNKIIRVQTTAADVIHSFAVPAFGIKIDAIPGRLNETWFKATKEGMYYGQCSELCGKDHAYMPIAIKVVSDSEFAAWVEAAKKKFASNPAATYASIGAAAQ